MDINKLHRISDYQWRIEAVNGMHVPGIIFASKDLILDMDEKVGQLRGKVHDYGTQKIPLVVTYHPAYLLRSPLEKRKVWEDLQFAQAVFKRQLAG